jgi:hypothetical protein
VLLGYQIALALRLLSLFLASLALFLGSLALYLKFAVIAGIGVTTPSMVYHRCTP